jgi:hypothetical protein
VFLLFSVSSGLWVHDSLHSGTSTSALGRPTSPVPTPPAQTWQQASACHSTPFCSSILHCQTHPTAPYQPTMWCAKVISARQPSARLPFCVSACMSICPPCLHDSHPFVFLSVFLLVCRSARPACTTAIRSSSFLCLCLYVYLSALPARQPSARLPFCHSASLSTCPSCSLYSSPTAHRLSICGLLLSIHPRVISASGASHHSFPRAAAAWAPCAAGLWAPCAPSSLYPIGHRLPYLQAEESIWTLFMTNNRILISVMPRNADY